MRCPWLLLLFFVAISIDVVVPTDTTATKLSVSDPTTSKRALATDDNAHQNKPLLRKSDDDKGVTADIAEERMIIVGMIRNKLRGIIARIKQAYRDFKTQVNNAKYDDWLLYSAAL